MMLLAHLVMTAKVVLLEVIVMISIVRQICTRYLVASHSVVTILDHIIIEGENTRLLGSSLRRRSAIW